MKYLTYIKVKIFDGIKFLKFQNIYGSLLALCLVVILFAIGTKGKFLSYNNIQTIFSLSGILAIVTLGTSLVILMGAIDLSPEGVIALSAIICGFLVKNPITDINIGFWVIFIVAIVGAIAGFINGIINTKLKIPSFIATLGIWFATLGLSVIISKGNTIQFLDPRYQKVANGNFLGIPYITMVSIGLCLVYTVVQKHTRLGKYIFAIGGNETLARQVGIKVEKVKIIVFAMAGFIYGIAAFFLGSRLQAANPTISKGFLFPAITATVVGGTSLSGGTGGALNAFIGALIVSSLNNGMVLMNISPYIQSAINGVVLIGAVALTIDRRKIGIIK